MVKLQTIAILTNSLAADQRSMIGYGEVVLDAAVQTGLRVVEWRCSSWFAKLPLRGLLRKLALNLDRFIVTPLMFFGRKTDLIHVVDPGNCIYLPLIRYRRSIVTVHDMIPYLANDGKLPGFTPTRTGRWLMNRILIQLSKVDHIVCDSDSTRRDLLTYVNIRPMQVSLIYIPVFQSMVPATLESCNIFRTHQGIPHDVPIVLHVGNHFYKNRPLVLEIFAQVRLAIPNVRLVLVGELEETLKAQVLELGIGDAIHVLKFVPRGEMATLYTTASVLLFPSLYEGFGYPVVEAEMCGTPVVCSDRGSLPEVAGKNTVIIPVSDLAKFVSEISSLIKKPRNIESNTSSIADITNKFSHDSWSNSYQHLFEYLINL